MVIRCGSSIHRHVESELPEQPQDAADSVVRGLSWLPATIATVVSGSASAESRELLERIEIAGFIGRTVWNTSPAITQHVRPQLDHLIDGPPERIGPRRLRAD